jgi:hypothetical protein
LLLLSNLFLHLAKMVASVQSSFQLQTRCAVKTDLTPRNYKELGPYGLCTAPAGSHIVVQAVQKGRQEVKWVHGIYVGNGSVAHMHLDGGIRIVVLGQFMGGIVSRDCYVGKAGTIEYEGDNDTKRALTCSLAHEATEQLFFPANCELFATWARSGMYVEQPSLSAILLAVPTAVYDCVHPKGITCF